jgi:DNA polymerase-3 subunit gamma/tau
VLSAIASDDGIEAADPALLVIARAAGGSFRDAIGILDQLSTYSGGKVTLEGALDILGVVRHDLLFEIVDYVREQNTQEALLFVERLSQAGTDYTQFIKDLLGHLRDVYVVKHTAETPASIAASEEQLDSLRSQAARCSTNLVVGFIDLLGETLRSIRQGSDPRLGLELVLIKMTASETRDEPRSPEVKRSSPASAAPDATPAPKQGKRAKPASTERTAPTANATDSSIEPESTTEASATTPEAPTADEPKTQSKDSAEEEQSPPAATVRADIEHLRRAWAVVLEAVKKRQPSLSAVLGEGSPSDLEGDTLIVKFPAGHGFQANQVVRGDNPRIITEALCEVTGKDLRVETVLARDDEPQPAAQDEDARILSKDELIKVLKQEFDAQLLDDDPHR